MFIIIFILLQCFVQVLKGEQTCTNIAAKNTTLSLPWTIHESHKINRIQEITGNDTCTNPQLKIDYVNQYYSIVVTQGVLVNHIKLNDTFFLSQTNEPEFIKFEHYTQLAVVIVILLLIGVIYSYGKWILSRRGYYIQMRIPPQIPVVFLSKVDKSTKERSKNKIDHDLESVDLFIPLHQSLPLSTSSLLPGVPNTEKKEHEYPVLKKFKTEILETAHVSMMYAQHIYIPPSTLETIIETDEEMNNSSSIVESKHIGESRSVTEITTKEILPLFKGQNIPPGTVGRPCIQNSKMETVTKPSLVSSALDISQKKAMPSRRRSIKSGQNKCLLCCLPCQNCFRSIKSFFRKHSSSNNTLTSVKQLDEITNTDRLVTSLVPNNDSIEIETWV